MSNLWHLQILHRLSEGLHHMRQHVWSNSSLRAKEDSLSVRSFEFMTDCLKNLSTISKYHSEYDLKQKMKKSANMLKIKWQIFSQHTLANSSCWIAQRQYCEFEYEAKRWKEKENFCHPHIHMSLKVAFVRYDYWHLSIYFRTTYSI